MERKWNDETKKSKHRREESGAGMEQDPKDRSHQWPGWATQSSSGTHSKRKKRSVTSSWQVGGLSSDLRLWSSRGRDKGHWNRSHNLQVEGNLIGSKTSKEAKLSTHMDRAQGKNTRDSHWNATQRENLSYKVKEKNPTCHSQKIKNKNRKNQLNNTTMELCLWGWE